MCFRTIRIGDVVVFKEPRNVDNLLVGRITALENWRIEPDNEKDRSFVLVENQCWVLSDNQELNPEVCASLCFCMMVFPLLRNLILCIKGSPR